MFRTPISGSPIVVQLLIRPIEIDKLPVEVDEAVIDLNAKFAANEASVWWICDYSLCVYAYHVF